jgi:hypothetical protein
MRDVSDTSKILGPECPEQDLTMSFRRYLAGIPMDCLSSGHFVSGVVKDNDLPDPESWDELKKYLRTKGATHVTVREAATFWRAYQQTRLR